MQQHLTLPAELTIYSVGELRPQWLAWLNRCRADKNGAFVEAGAVAEVDAAGVQLLLSLARQMQAEQRPMTVLNASAALVTACGALGLSALLDTLRAEEYGHGQ